MSKEQQDLKRAVDRFAEQMTLIYGDEESRRTDGLLALNNILSLGGNNNKLMPASIGSVNTDGHYDGPLEAAACIIEFRNDLGAINSIPVVELTSYVAHSHALAMKRYESAFRNWRVPCLGITVVGKSNISGSSDESDMMYINEVLVLHSTLSFSFSSGASSLSPLRSRESRLRVKVPTDAICMQPSRAPCAY